MASKQIGLGNPPALSLLAVHRRHLAAGRDDLSKQRREEKHVLRRVPSASHLVVAILVGRINAVSATEANSDEIVGLLHHTFDRQADVRELSAHVMGWRLTLVQGVGACEGSTSHRDV